MTYTNKILWFKNFYNSLLLSIFILVAIFHLRLGLTVVIEDYIHSLEKKKTLLSLFRNLVFVFSRIYCNNNIDIIYGL